jgi:beta-galactosidase
MQPNFGLDTLFGARESDVEFTPDLLDDLRVTIPGGTVRGGLFLQRYETAGGEPTGRYADGSIAMVDHHAGRGRTRLIGTFPGYGRFHHPSDETPFFRELLAWAGMTLHVQTNDSRLTARLHDGDGGVYLWVTNPTRERRLATLTLSERWGAFTAAHLHWGEGTPRVAGRNITVTVGPRDAAVVRLTP